jgi:propanol-preferring alcohol dehydrogenase
MAGEGRRLGLYGFGSAAQIVAQVARADGREVYAFTRPHDEAAPASLDAAIIFAPDGALVPTALRAVVPGGTVVCGGIHMSDIPSFPYASLWEERTLRSVANLTRADATEFLALAPHVPVATHVHSYPLEAANEALADLRAGRFTGAAVVVPDHS